MDLQEYTIHITGNLSREFYCAINRTESVGFAFVNAVDPSVLQNSIDRNRDNENIYTILHQKKTEAMIFHYTHLLFAYITSVSGRIFRIISKQGSTTMRINCT